MRNVPHVDEQRAPISLKQSMVLPTERNSMSQTGIDKDIPNTSYRLEKILQIEWLGQTLASLCWIASVFSYGINSGGDWLQLAAAASWLAANTAAIFAHQTD